jgi:hypothetical protein
MNAFLSKQVHQNCQKAETILLAPVMKAGVVLAHRRSLHFTQARCLYASLARPLLHGQALLLEFLPNKDLLFSGDLYRTANSRKADPDPTYGKVVYSVCELRKLSPLDLRKLFPPLS